MRALALRRVRASAAIAGLAFVVHGGNHVRRGEAWDLLWMCNLAPLLLALGCVLMRPLPVVIALEWLAFGAPMWLLDLATGSDVIWTSFLPHVACPVAAVIALRELGMPRVGWPFATAGMGLLWLTTRLVTPEAPNVNAAFRVWSGWEATFPRYDLYIAVVMTGAALTFFAVEKGARLAFPAPTCSESSR